MKRIMEFLKDERGATAIEYALMAALISVVIILTVTSMGEEVNTTFNSVDNALTQANAP